MYYMTCYMPLPSEYGNLNANLKRPMRVFPRTPENLARFPLRMPCGRCIGCRLTHSRDWAVRIMHESKLHKFNSFITLTYDDDHLPPFNSLVLKDLQDFWKRLRSSLDYKFGIKFRYYSCGEYGSLFQRPHYHACLFGYDFPDKSKFKISKLGHAYYRSELLEQSWTAGYSSVADLTFESAAYVSRYVTKKVTGDAAFFNYSVIDPDTGEFLSSRKPEFATMSRRPGIAKYYFDKHYSDWYANDFLLTNSKGKLIQSSIPRYYDKQYELLYPAEYDQIKDNRILKIKESIALNPDNFSEDRLHARHKFKLSQIKSLRRSLE